MKSNKSGGIGFCGALALLFVALKLLGKIGWAWTWVLAPLWIPACFVVLVFVVAFLVGALAALVRRVG